MVLFCSSGSHDFLEGVLDDGALSDGVYSECSFQVVTVPDIPISGLSGSYESRSRAAGLVLDTGQDLKTCVLVVQLLSTLWLLGTTTWSPKESIVDDFVGVGYFLVRTSWCGVALSSSHGAFRSPQFRGSKRLHCSRVRGVAQVTAFESNDSEIGAPTSTLLRVYDRSDVIRFNGITGVAFISTSRQPCVPGRQDLR